MTTSLDVIDGGRNETLTMAVARRLRGKLAERRISGLRLAEMTGLGRSLVNRRLQGETAMNTDELELIERVTGISAVYLLTGMRQETPRPDGPDGGDECAIRDLNPEPAD
jgi:transcriptional regulator with XRE-family HTH domain